MPLNLQSLSAALLFAQLLLCSCSATVGVDDAGTVRSDAGSSIACASPTGTGTSRTSPTADETWTAEASPHRIANTLTIPEGVTVTIAPCATVKLGDGADLVVNGKLVALGAQGRKIEFGRLDSAKAWGRLDATRTRAKPPIDLAWVTLEGGGLSTGLDLETSSMIRVRANGGSGGEPMIRVDQVELRGSSSVGIELGDSATFAVGSTGLSITGSASAPVRMSGWALTNLPEGDFSGNAVDHLVIDPTERIGVSGTQATVVMHKRNVPYRIGVFGSNSVLTLGAPTGNALTTLRIEASTTVAFNKDTGIYVAHVSNASSGELIVSGTANEPVTMTSAASVPAAGDWRGIMFGAPPTSATMLDHVVFQYSGSTNTQTSGFSCGTEPAPAGLKRGIMGALSFATDQPVMRQILTNSIIRDSGSNGIDRGWKGDPVDYLATNTFERIAYCRQTGPKPTMGQCALSAPCD